MYPEISAPGAGGDCPPARASRDADLAPLPVTAHADRIENRRAGIDPFAFDSNRRGSKLTVAQQACDSHAHRPSGAFTPEMSQ